MSQQSLFGDTYADRLERVRQSEGYDTLRDYHAALVSDGYTISYEAVRTYHIAGRTPPVEYLVRVARRFGVRLDWLATGEGSMRQVDRVAERVMEGDATDEPTGEPEEFFRACLRGVREELGWWNEAQADPALRMILAQAAYNLFGRFVEDLDRKAQYAARGVRTGQVAPKRLRSLAASADAERSVGFAEEAGRLTAQAVLAPLDRLGINQHRFEDAQLYRYMTAVAIALAGLEFHPDLPSVNELEFVQDVLTQLAEAESSADRAAIFKLYGVDVEVDSRGDVVLREDE